MSKEQEQSSTITVEAPPEEQTEQKPEQKTKPGKPRPKQPAMYHVILWDDNDHTPEYVIEMMIKLFAHPLEKGVEIAETVHHQGKAICLTAHKELAELKRDQITAFGADHRVAECKGAMYATIEKAR